MAGFLCTLRQRKTALGGSLTLYRVAELTVPSARALVRPGAKAPDSFLEYYRHDSSRALTLRARERSFPAAYSVVSPKFAEEQMQVLRLPFDFAQGRSE